MMKDKTLLGKIEYRIKRSKASVYVLADFFDLSGSDQILRALRALVKKSLIIRVGQGIYARAKISSITNQPIPEKDMRTVAIEALIKTGVKVKPTRYEKSYNEGKTTQVPLGLLIGVNKRVSRKIGFNGKYVKYEKVA